MMRTAVLLSMLPLLGGGVFAEEGPRSDGGGISARRAIRFVSSLPVYESDDALWVFAEEVERGRTLYSSAETVRLHIWLLDRDGVLSEHHFQSSLTLDNITAGTVIFRLQEEVYARRTVEETEAKQYFRLEERGFLPFSAGREFVEEIQRKLLTDEELLAVSKRNGLTRIGDPLSYGGKSIQSKRFGWEFTTQNRYRVVARKNGGAKELVLLDLIRD